MKKLLFAVLALFVFLPLAAQAQNATLTLPSVTFTLPVSTGINCTETAASNLVLPVASGTVIFTCAVMPVNWAGAVSLNGSGLFAVSGLSGNTFNVVLTSAVTAPATDAPGTLTAVP
jgi:hypothetical protein